MSSATYPQPNAGKTVIGATAPQLGAVAGGADALAKVARLGMSPRQQHLNLLWARYCAQHYDARRYDWNGREIVDPLTREAIASGNAIPPGFYDAGGQMVPLTMRKPTAPYNLGRVIVNRFTGLLFSSRHHPQARVPGDASTEDFTRALIDSSRLWAQMITARNFGGATGSACVGFQFVDGLPRVEVHDPRWTTPDFKDRDRLILRKVEKRYMFNQPQRSPETGEWIDVWYWSRRVIDENSDTLWESVPVADGEEPKWDELPSKNVQHNFGFCPCVWIQNTPVLDDIDGEPDCAGVFDTLDTIDALLAQANLGTVSNCDPTLLITSDKPLPAIAKGSDNAIKLPKGDDAKYIEIEGGGPKSARELATEFRAMALEVAQCVLDQPNQAAAVTATEIERRYSSMIERTDVFREQYGERGVKPLLEMMIKAARKFMQVQQDPATNRPVQQFLRLPPRVITDPNNPDQVDRVARKLSESPGNLELHWPAYFSPTADDAQKRIMAAAAAKAASLVDTENAANYVAEVFGVEDVPAMLRRIGDEAARAQAVIEEMAMKGVTGVALGTAAKSGAGIADRGEEQNGDDQGDQGEQPQDQNQQEQPQRQRPQQQDGEE